ncbi:MAG: HAMP domain-containing histidine kinase [Lachnospiraceae bacterium]|nr:HAMP domain-containing histidine kinase [Lachnospiraceae bacterium]
MFHSIKTRLIFIFIVFLILIEAAQFILIYFFLDTAFLQQKSDTALNAFTEINDDRMDDPEIFSDIVEVMREYETTTNLYFCIIDRESKEVKYSTNESITNEEFDFKNVDDSVYDDEGDPRVINGYNSIKWLVIYRNVVTDEHIYNVAVWTCYEAELNNTILSLAPLIVLMAIIASFVLGTILAVAFSNYIVRPIKQIDETATAIATQDFSHVITLPRAKDEFYRLSMNINIMSEQLKLDMDTLKEYNQQLEQDIEEKIKIDQMRRQFLSNVSHELKTPLAILSSYAEMLMTEGDRIDRNEYLSVIVDEAREMSSLVGDLLNVSRLEHATEYLELENTCVSDIAGALTDSRRVLFEQEELNISNDIEEGLYANADEVYLSQAFDNFLSNALKYCKKKGNVKVSMKEIDDIIEYKVYNDTDKPLPEEELSSIWESFYKMDKSRTQDGNMSVGLGLYIVKTIIDAHNGSYYAENVENGVNFVITLPKEKSPFETLNEVEADRENEDSETD